MESLIFWFILVFLILILVLAVGFICFKPNVVAGGGTKPKIPKKSKPSKNIFNYEDIPTHVAYTASSRPKNKHIGQRKLLVNEINFLAQNPGRTVVYAGAAPGIHIKLLAELFPEREFILYDPHKFAISPTDRIRIVNTIFTDTDAKQYAGQDVLFISDIRSGEDHMSHGDFEKSVAYDLELQKKCIHIMKPKKSMLKFRLPFNSDEISYFDGDIILQPWAPPTSAETRLITDGSGERKYVLREYENRMYYVNNNLRAGDTAWDYALEKHLLTPYIKQSGMTYTALMEKIDNIYHSS